MLQIAPRIEHETVVLPRCYRTTPLCAFLLLTVVTLYGGAALAQGELPANPTEPDTDYATVVVADDTRNLNDPAFVTSIHVGDVAGETVTVAEALAESVGVSVRSLGGLGSFSSVSVRGASPSHTSIAIDGIPLSQIAFAATNLNSFDLASFGQIDIYRGGVPVELGGAALGGAVNFITAVGPTPVGETIQLSAGAGSFGAQHMQAHLRDEALDAALTYHVAAGYRAATGDYTYFNNHGTNLESDDDTYDTRSNNGFYQLHTLGRGRYRKDGFTVEGGTRVSWKNQDLPGLATVPQTEQANLATYHQLTDMRLDQIAPMGIRSLRISGTTFFMYERQHYSDILGEIGLAAVERKSRSVSVGTLGRALYGIERHFLSSALDFRADTYDDDDLLAVAEAPSGAQGRRLGGALGASDEISFSEGKLAIIPALRLDWQHTDPGENWDPAIIDVDMLEVRSEFFASPRIGVRSRLDDSLVVKANAGRYFRAPTLIELFGDRGLIAGKPTLQAETGLTADAGFLLSMQRPDQTIERIHVEAAAFGAMLRSAIATLPTSGNRAVAQNVGDATIWGLETAGRVRLARKLLVTANYTFVHSEQSVEEPTLAPYKGKQLPLRPRHELYGRGDVFLSGWGRPLSVWTDATFTSGNFLDKGNTARVPERFLLGAGIKVQPTRNLQVGFSAKNLTDNLVKSVPLSPAPGPSFEPQAIADFLNYPLPGRALYLNVEISH